MTAFLFLTITQGQKLKLKLKIRIEKVDAKKIQEDRETEKKMSEGQKYQKKGSSDLVKIFQKEKNDGEKINFIRMGTKDFQILEL